MACTSASILKARRAVLTVATALVASTIAGAAVITGMIAVIDGGAATSKRYSRYRTTITLKESGKIVPINRVVRARSEELATTLSPWCRSVRRSRRNSMRSLAGVKMSHSLGWFARLTGGFFLLALRRLRVRRWGAAILSHQLGG